MVMTIETALASPSVTIVEVDRERSIFKIRIGKLQTVIIIKMFFDEDSKLWRFDQSHKIKTPAQAGPYHPGVRVGEERGWLLAIAINGFTSFYLNAERKGFEPEEGWLLKWKI
jgi:hypothetical protein